MVDFLTTYDQVTVTFDWLVQFDYFSYNDVFLFQSMKYIVFNQPYHRNMVSKAGVQVCSDDWNIKNHKSMFWNISSDLYFLLPMCTKIGIKSFWISKKPSVLSLNIIFFHSKRRFTEIPTHHRTETQRVIELFKYDREIFSCSNLVDLAFSTRETFSLVWQREISFVQLVLIPFIATG